MLIDVKEPEHITYKTLANGDCFTFPLLEDNIYIKTANTQEKLGVAINLKNGEQYLVSSLVKVYLANVKLVTNT